MSNKVMMPFPISVLTESSQNDLCPTKYAVSFGRAIQDILIIYKSRTNEKTPAVFQSLKPPICIASCKHGKWLVIIGLPFSFVLSRKDTVISKLQARGITMAWQLLLIKFHLNVQTHKIAVLRKIISWQ